MHELNVIKKPWREDHLRIALVYPNVYSAMAGLTIQTLYNLWNQFPNVICERFFMPSKKEIRAFKSQNLPLSYDTNTGPARFYPALRSMENQMPLSKFDIIAFSISYELDFTNVLWMLDNSHIPIFRNDRISKKNKEKEEDEEELEIVESEKEEVKVETKVDAKVDAKEDVKNDVKEEVAAVVEDAPVTEKAKE